MKLLYYATVAVSLIPEFAGAAAWQTTDPVASSAVTEPAASAAAPVAQSGEEPFAFADFTWVPANKGASDRPLALGPFTAELRLDTAVHYEFTHPDDDTIAGSSEVFRHGEFQLIQLGVGGDLLYKDIIARVMTQFGMYSETTPRNDSSPARGAWHLDDAYRYLSEAYGGYHFDVMHGLNVEAGIFMSYVGLWSYYNADNWTYQPSYVSSNTPWFFNGVRAQFFPTTTLKIEPWLINGWQAYGRFNNAPGVGLQVMWRPTGNFSMLGNQYFGADTLGVPDRKRIHTDDSIMVKYYDSPTGFVNKAAASLTVDAGCEMGGGVTCSSQYFLGFMAYNRLWFGHDIFALTVGGGGIKNPGRYLVLLPPINGATATSGTPYFTMNPGDGFWAWDTQVTFDYMPMPYITLRAEYNHRGASVPYFAGKRGMTPPGGQQGAPGSSVTGWQPDLVEDEDRLTLALLIKI